MMKKKRFWPIKMHLQQNSKAENYPALTDRLVVHFFALWVRNQYFVPPNSCAVL